MVQTIEEALRAGVTAALGRLQIDGAGTRIEIRPSAKPEFGDLSTPIALSLAKRLGQRPLDLAQRLATALEEALPAHILHTNVTPPGFVNFFIDEPGYAADLAANILAAGDRYGYASAPTGLKLVIEHTNINSNKAAHVGHLRNACLGDTVSRILRALGNDVEVQNYIDDTGVQVADVVVGMQMLGRAYDEAEPFDYFASRVYAEVQRRYEAEPALLERRKHVLREIEERGSATAQMAKELSLRIVARHLRTMGRVGVAYDLLTWESDILALGFWRHAFVMLRERNLLEHPDTGPMAGCWVVPFGEGATTTAGGERSSDKVLVKSDGVVTYTGKDLAYQLWKFGLLDRDFGYQRWDKQWNGSDLWTTTDDPAQMPPRAFGHAARVINVIDVRQSYPQEVVYESLRRLGFLEQAEASVHLSYEVVALSAEAARTLGVPVEEGKATYAFSGRQGIEVKADDLLNLATQHMAAKLEEQQTAGRGKSSDAGTAEALATGAVRYYLLKFGLTQVIPFDFDDALRHTGDTGVYLQYAYARACNVLQRAGAAPEADQPATILPADKALALALGRLPAIVEEAGSRLAPAILARYAFELATAFSDFYEHTPALYKEADPAARRFRLRLVEAFRQTFHNTLELLGIPPLEAI
ncbi:MAG TPA: arginine--tRNA ligase [Chloroflexota bacterium]